MSIGHLTCEQKWNIKRTYQIREIDMSHFLQDIASLVSMSAFLVATAALIGAL